MCGFSEDICYSVPIEYVVIAACVIMLKRTCTERIIIVSTDRGLFHGILNKEHTLLWQQTFFITHNHFYIPPQFIYLLCQKSSYFR